MSDGFITPNIRIAAIVTQAIEELGKVQVKITQECIHTHHIRQSNT